MNHAVRSLRWALAAALLAAALTSCGSSQGAGEDSPAPITHTPPRPAGIETILPGAPTAPTPAGADCGDPTASLRPRGDIRGAALDAIRARGHLLVGLDTGSNLFSFRDATTGIIEGFDVDIARAVAADMFGDPERVRFRLLGSQERITALVNRDVDLIVKTMSITCERRRQVNFSTEYFRAHQRVLALRPMAPNGPRGDIPSISSSADLAGKRVCVVSGTTSLQHIRRIQPTATVVTVPTWADCLVVLQQRQADAVTTDDALLAGLAQQDQNHLQIVGPNLSDEPYGIGIAQGAEDLVRFVNRTLERIRQDGTWDRSYRRWLSILGPSPGPPTAHYQD
ncbi:MAG: glutamate ABC transporter substrate-binding protein [Mycobacteriaceae bacterium]|nr:glutamate ABC transporter substrate-binding protein [Mycobacteriaceae bacterium]